MKFSVSVDNGASKEIDLTQRLKSTTGVTTSAVTETQIITAMNEELQLAFDDNLTVAYVTASGVLTIADEK